MSEKVTGKRVLAFIIDMVIISFVVNIFSNIKLLNPYVDKYNETSNELFTYVIQNGYTDLISKSEKVEKYIYDLSYYGIYLSIINLIVVFLYFVCFQYFNKGKTLGKSIFNIKIISNDNKKLKFKQILIRSIIVNSIFTSLLSIIMIIVFKDNNYNTYTSLIEMLDMGLIFLCFGFMLYREDGRGLHDLISNTKVVSNDYEINKKKKEK